MAERHADIVARIANVEQLQAVVTAMRGIAGRYISMAKGPTKASRPSTNPVRNMSESFD